LPWLRRIHGRGVDGEQAKAFYLPEAHTDFIYACFRELGFIGAIFVIGLFAVYGWRGLRAAFSAPDSFAGFWRSASRRWCSVRR